MAFSNDKVCPECELLTGELTNNGVCPKCDEMQSVVQSGLGADWGGDAGRRHECYQCKRKFKSREQVAVHQYHHPGHYVPESMKPVLKELGVA